MEDFATWARAEIARHRTEAETLERALEQYLQRNGKQAFTPPFGSFQAGGATPPADTMRRHPRRPKESQSAFIMRHLREVAGAGATPLEIRQAAEKEGYRFNSNSVRSQIWQKKKDGKITEHEGRYYTAEGGKK